jgi:hypothetical protein
MFAVNLLLPVNTFLQEILIAELPREHGTVSKIKDYYEKTIPQYNLNDFRYYFRLTPSGFEKLTTTLAQIGKDIYLSVKRLIFKFN